MKRKVLKLDVDAWLTDRRLRLCTPAARAFLIDLKALCVPSGKLVVDDVPLSDDQIAVLCGCSVETVQAMFKELAAAKAFEVDTDGYLFFPDMVKDFEFKTAAKVSGAKAARKPKGILGHTVGDYQKALAESHSGADDPRRTPSSPPAPTQSVAAPKPTTPAKKIADWWLTPAGWGRKGQEQAVSKGENESMLDFQIRIAKRLPDGPHLDMLPKHAAKAIRADIAEHAKKSEE